MSLGVTTSISPLSMAPMRRSRAWAASAMVRLVGGRDVAIKQLCDSRSSVWRIMGVVSLGDSVPERGFVDALSRFRQWLQTGDYQQPTQFREVLSHLYELENLHGNRLANRYFSIRDQDPTGQVVGGIVYARGLAVHHNIDVASLIGSRPFTFGRSQLGGGDALGGQGVSMQWVGFQELPSPHPKHPARGRDKMYELRVAGRDALATFQDTETFFEMVRQIT